MSIKLSADEITALNFVAKNLDVPASWIYSIIQTESSWNPQATASIPYNKALVTAGKDVPRYAKGLIQFIDSTARGLGFVDSSDLVRQYPDIKSQLLGPVQSYLFQFHPFTNEQNFAMSIFNPAYRNVSPGAAVSSAITASNPTIKKVSDYMAIFFKNIPTSLKGVLVDPRNDLIIVAAVFIGIFVVYKLIS